MRKRHVPSPRVRGEGRGSGMRGNPELRLQNVGGVQALITSQGTGPTQRNRCGRRLSK